MHHPLRAHPPNFLETNPTFARMLNILEADLRLEVFRLGRFLHNAVQFVNLLECQAFRLVDHEPDEDDADEAEGAPDLRACQQWPESPPSRLPGCRYDLRRTPCSADSHTQPLH